LSLLALLYATSAIAKTDQPSMMEFAGQCQPPDSFAFQLSRLMGFSSSLSINCTGAKTDWQSSIEFFKSSESNTPILKFIGKPEPGEYSLKITAVVGFQGNLEPATGRCQMFRPDESGGKRDIACFAEAKRDKGAKQASFVRFTIEDEVLALGETKTYSGNCSTSRISELVIKEEVARVYEEYRPIELISVPACDSAIMVGGQSVSFINTKNPKYRLVFSGIANDTELPKAVIAGACGGIRRMDGVLHMFCRAAYEENGKVKAVSVEFPEPLPTKY
jgi:hypothetical protein